ncbi:plasma membrane ascorbate-dependent reductase CYBRD1 isoform X1 [Neocloeon triangulifer]|uniref:plasma membrane ascorbate-dependent reductase CYBRD1 isoform X1 n=1 Tax=Neocloeon triangulifer TaxID=2078957 RepID=UPI00286F36B2|nr:plasma membrane ascorbate-dependent reductase CYBRD1 isoform X1 [Neocloeon triangulifer]
MENSLTESAPMAEFDKSPQDELDGGPDDLPPPPTTIGAAEDQKSRSYSGENRGGWACGNWFEFLLVVVVASILLLGALGLVIFWVFYYRNGVGWLDEPELLFNYHPILMIGGFITLSGFSVLMYRICRCCRRIYVKLLHTFFHLLAMPCIALGFIAVLESHNRATPEPIPNFYSLHSWMGFVTMGLFALQFVVGFFSFLVLLCCESATASFRAALVPIHATFGITTFLLAVATCLTGLTEKVIFTLKSEYSGLPEEGIVVNALAMVLVAIAIFVSYALARHEFKYKSHMLVSIQSDL